MIIGIDDAQLEAEIVEVEEPVGDQVVAGFGDVRVDDVVGGGQEGGYGRAGDGVAPGDGDVGAAAVGAPEAGVGEDAGVEGAGVEGGEGAGGEDVRVGAGWWGGWEGGDLRSGYGVRGIGAEFVAGAQG